MPTLNIGGQKIKVGDEFLQMTPEQQNAAVEEISKSLQPQAAPAPDPRAATAPMAPPAQAGTMPTPDGVTGRGLASSALQGLSFGFGDELAGALGAVPAALTTGTSIPEAYRGIRDIAREERKEFEGANPNVALASEVGGGLLGGTGLIKAGMAIPKTIGGAVKQAGLLGGVYGAGTSEQETVPELLGDVAKGAVLGGVTGGALPAIGKGLSTLGEKVVQPATSKVYRAAVDKLQDAGISLTTGQKTGSDRVKAVEGSLGSTLLGGEIGKTMNKGREQFQKKLMGMAGFTKDDVTEGLVTAESLSNAGDNLSKQYTKALAGKTVNLADDAFIDSLANISQKHSELLPVDQKKAVGDIVDSLLDKATQGPITGQKYQSLRSDLGRLERKTQGPVGDLYGDLKRALDDQFTNAVDNVTAQTKKGLDKQYAQYKQLDTLYNRTGGQEVSSGVLPLASLNRLAKKSPGSKEWKELVNSASQVLSSKTPDSKTASHLLNMALAGGGGALLANPATALGTLATGGLLYGGAKALGKGLTPQISQAAQQNLGRLGLLSVPGTQATASEAGLLR